MKTTGIKSAAITFIIVLFVAWAGGVDLFARGWPAGWAYALAFAFAAATRLWHFLRGGRND